MALDPDPLWYQDAIIYELHVRAFMDSNGDGIGDFRGLEQRLDYLQDLGVTALWLLPFYPSPLRDDGYDIADYNSINPSYGDMDDFRRFLDAAHARGLRVITELVINHTSDQHPWFQRARRDEPGGRWREYYVWTDDPSKYRDTRIIFQDFEHSNWSWDHEAQAYYWHRFYHHQPDLNFDNPEVHDAVIAAMDFWFDMGVDGLRLDAIPYLYEREGTNCENLPETHVFLKKLRAHVDQKYADKMLLAEANQWPEDAVEYFGDGDECHMNFHFPLMPRLYMALQQEDRFPIVDILEQTPDLPEGSQWAIFLRNHDELTLEMVTDEERDYMYRAYARQMRARINMGIRRRLAPLLEGDRRKIELMNGLLFSLPGTPVLYYGDEIGMGDNIWLGDRNGVRTPMQWSGDRNAGFSRANPQQLFLPAIIDPEYHYEAINVEVQQQNPSSLLWWTRRLIALRKRFQAFGRGEIEFLRPDNRKILAFIRRFEDEAILVVVNLSRFPQYCELDMSEWAGQAPVELFGRQVFPPFGDLPYFLTLGPYSIQWFSLQEAGAAARRPWALEGAASAEAPRLEVTSACDIDSVLNTERTGGLTDALERYIRGQRWFGNKSGHIRGLSIGEAVPLELGGEGASDDEARLCLVDISYVHSDDERYVVPLVLACGEHRERALAAHYPVVAHVHLQELGVDAVLYDGIGDPRFAQALLTFFGGGQRASGEHGRLEGRPLAGWEQAYGDGEDLEPRALQADQSNTSIVYGGRIFVKMFRKLEPGESLDAELGRFLTEQGFTHTPTLLASLNYQLGGPEDPPCTVAIAQVFTESEGNAWSYTLDELADFLEFAVAHETLQPPELPAEPGGLEELSETDESIGELDRQVGTFLDNMELLGRRTAEMHLALASGPIDDDAFAAQEFSQLYQRALYQSMRNLVGNVFDKLRRGVGELPEAHRPRAKAMLARRDEILERLRRIVGQKIDAERIRTHGDYHLGQVLYTGKDFIIIDFEGEPARALSERRIKRSPLRDVAGMIRSLHYAAAHARQTLSQRGLAPERITENLERWTDWWLEQTTDAYLRGYLEIAADASFMPSQDDFDRLLDAFVLEKAVYELGYELDNRPDWLPIPLHGIETLLAT